MNATFEYVLAPAAAIPASSGDRGVPIAHQEACLHHVHARHDAAEQPAGRPQREAVPARTRDGPVPRDRHVLALHRAPRLLERHGAHLAGTSSAATTRSPPSRFRRRLPTVRWQERLFFQRFWRLITSTITKVYLGIRYWLKPGMANAGDAGHVEPRVGPRGRHRDLAGRRRSPKTKVQGIGSSSGWCSRGCGRTPQTLGFFENVKSEPWHWEFCLGDTIPRACSTSGWRSSAGRAGRLMPAELFGRDATEILVRAAAAVVALGTLWRYLVRPTWRGVRGFVHGVQLAVDGVEYVRAQMENNGGSTTKGAIDRTEAKVDLIAARLDGIDARVEFLEQVHRKQAEVDQIVAENAAKLDAIRPTLHLPRLPTDPEVEPPHVA